MAADESPWQSEHDPLTPPRVLVVTNIYPTADAPTVGLFIRDQVESLRALPFPVEVLHVDRRAEGRSGYRRLIDRVRERLDATHADLVHVMYGGVMADLITRRLTRVPIIVSFYGTDLLGGRQGPALTRLRHRYGAGASRRAAVRAAGVIVQSRVLADALPHAVDERHVWIVPSGVDLRRFEPSDRDTCRRQLGWDQGVRHVFFPWSPERVEKRYWLARAAVTELTARGVATKLHATDRVGHDEMPLWLNASDALLLTSTHEGSPNAVKEALACNVPVVSVDVGDVRERVEGLAASSIAAAKPDALAAALERAFAHAPYEDGRARVTDLGLRRVAERVARIYTVVASRLYAG